MTIVEKRNFKLNSSVLARNFYLLTTDQPFQCFRFFLYVVVVRRCESNKPIIIYIKLHRIVLADELLSVVNLTHINVIFNTIVQINFNFDVVI